MAPRSALSYSSVRTYLECPLRWKFLYVDDLKEAPRGYFSFGRTVHSVLEELLKPLVVPSGRRVGAGATQHTLDDWRPGDRPQAGRLPTREQMMGLYESAWIGEGYGSRDEEKRYKQLGEEMLVAYHDDLLRAPPAPVSVEEHLEAKWNGVAVHGYIDRIDRTPTDGLEILDYKTSRELTQTEAVESDQLSVYQVLVQENYPEPVERLTLYHLRSRTPRSVPRRDAVVLDGVHERFTRAGDGIRSESFEPTPGRQCSRCEFRSLCPEFRVVPEPDQAQLLQLVDRFHQLRAEEENVEVQLRATAEALHKEAERLGVHRISGSDRVAIRRREEVWRFREESVAPILAEHGLEGQVRPDDSEAIRRLAQDPKVDAGLRRRLTEAGGRQVRWYWELEDSASRP